VFSVAALRQHLFFIRRSCLNIAGASAINWALIKGETVTGLSLFWVDRGIDTGPVLLQKELKVEPDDTTGSL